MSLELKTALFGAVSATFIMSAPANASQVYFDGFEGSTTWFGTNAVASGTNGVTSADGSGHGEFSDSGATYTRWGGYGTAAAPYSTSLDIWLDVNAGFSNDSRFDYSSAINDASGNHLQDFVFNAGFYNDESAGNRFVISASNNATRSSAYPKNPGKNPIAISTSGWYTFEHVFGEQSGFLSVAMRILDSSGSAVGSWEIGGVQPFSNVGGNRYGWLVFNELDTLAFDNASMRTIDSAVVPLPAAGWLLLGGIGGLAALKRRKRSA